MVFQTGAEGVFSPALVQIVSVNSSIGAQGHAAWRAGRMGSWMTFDLDYAGRDRALKTRCTSSA